MRRYASNGRNRGLQNGTEAVDRRWKQCGPNKAVELTGKKLALFPSSSPRALGF
jgi:hypothetical protein